MFQLHSAKSPIDASFFLKSLNDVFIREGHSFYLHAQQDVVEVLEILLEELTGPSTWLPSLIVRSFFQQDYN